MKAVGMIFLQNFRQYIRDHYTLFWSLAFPLLLMVILVLVFGNLGQGDINFQISLVNLADTNGDINDLDMFSGPQIGPGVLERDDLSVFGPGAEGLEIESRADVFSSPMIPVLIEEMLVSIAQDEEHSWLELFRPEAGTDRLEFLEREKELLREGQRHAILVIPPGLNEQVMAKIGYHYTGIGSQPGAGEITIYRRPESQYSVIASEVLAGIIGEFNRQTNVYSGLVDRSELLAVTEGYVEVVEGAGFDFSYTDYLIPGIILMTLMTSGLQILVEKVASLRERGILRRYYATPLSKSHYFSGLIVYLLVVSLLQLLVVYGAGRLFFNFERNIFQLQALGYMGYALLVFIVVAFVILSFTDSMQSGSALAQGAFYPLIFLGGLFFPVTNLPGILGIIVRLNPVTYLINGLREALGVYSSPTSSALNLLIPGIWLIAGILISLKFFTWNPGGEG